MINIEIENKTYNVPNSWEDLALGTYEDFCALPGETRPDKVARVAFLAGMDPSDLMTWPVDVYNRVAGMISFIFEQPAEVEPAQGIEIDGVKYTINIADRLTLGEWVDAEDAQKDSARVISGVLATVCRPAGEKYDPSKTDERVALFRAQPVPSLLPLINFILTFSAQLSKITAMRSELEDLAALLPKSGRSFAAPGGGITGSSSSQGATS